MRMAEGAGGGEARLVAWSNGSISATVKGFENPLPLSMEMAPLMASGRFESLNCLQKIRTAPDCGSTMTEAPWIFPPRLSLVVGAVQVSPPSMELTSLTCEVFCDPRKVLQTAYIRP